VVPEAVETGDAGLLVTGDRLAIMMQEREHRRAIVSTISGKRSVRSFPGRL
jgi:hypothetical protein